MEPSAVEAALADRVASVHAGLTERWGSVPHSSRILDSRGYEYPESPDDVFPHVSVCFVVDEAGGPAADTTQNRVLVCRDEKHDDLEWEPPGGRGQGDETPAETATREVREETGLDVDIRNLLTTEVLRFDHGHAVMPVLQAVFVAERTGGALDPEPGIEPRWFPVDDLPEETQYKAVVRSALASESE